MLVRQCLERRLPDKETLHREVKAWQGERNRKEASVDWRFTTADARIKLRKLYSSIDGYRRTRIRGEVCSYDVLTAPWTLGATSEAKSRMEASACSWLTPGSRPQKQRWS